MTPREALAALLDHNAQVWSDGGELCLRAPQGAMTDAVRAAAREVKAELARMIGPGRKYAPASHSQQRLWFLEALEPGSGAYTMHASYVLEGDFGLERAREAVARVSRRHEALRTQFERVENILAQVIVAEAPPPVIFHDFSELADETAEEDARRAAVALAQEPFDLAQAPLLRVLVCRLAAKRHVLAFIMHHIVSDGWSARLLTRDFLACCEAARGGTEPALPPLPVQFADAVCRRRAALADELDADLAYWRGKLCGPLPVVELPGDRPRPAAQSFRGGREARVLPEALRAALQQMARREDATLYTVLLAAFHVLLYRYSGARDIVIGSPVAGRTEPDVEHAIGFFANTLALRTPVAGEQSFRAYLGQVRETVLDAQSHQQMPFDKLVETLQPARSLAHSPVFQVVFALQNVPRREFEMSDLRITKFPFETGRTRFDLSLTIGERTRGFVATVEYSRDLFDGERMARLLEHYEHLLQGIADAPDTPIAALPILSPVELRNVLVAWNETAASCPEHLTLDAMIKAQSERTPGAVAAQEGRDSVTYAGLEARAEALAERLRGLGAGPGKCAALLLPRGIGLVAAVYGVLKSGAAFVPIDPDAPPARIAFSLRDCAAVALVTTRALQDRAEAPACPVIVIEDVAGEATCGCRAECDVTPSDAAYVVYTSGSTGTPKGVIVPHRGAVNLAVWQGRYYDLQPGDRVLQFASPAFDAFVSELTMALCTGAALVVPERETILDPAALARFLADQRITHATFPPTMLRLLPELALPDLKALLSAGETCDPALAARWAARAPFYNAYGPTECSVCASVYRCTGAESQLVPIGAPVANVRLYVLDTHGCPSPVGVPGELYIGGVSLADGYLNRPDLTVAAFVEMTLPLAGRQRLYRTGDMVRRRAEGLLEYLGRRDSQVKLRGFRIELGEIEAALSEHAGVRACAAHLRAVESGGQELVACYVPADGPLEPAALHAHMRARVPAYMIPARFVALDALPVTVSGKIDQQVMRAAARPLPEEQTLGALPDETEERLSRVWREVLRREHVSASENFFEAGGHSLLIFLLLDGIQKAFGVTLPVSAVFEHPTLPALAARVREALTGDRAAPAGDAVYADTIIPLRTGGARPPLFFAAPASGLVYPYYNLTLVLGPDQPVFGLQDPRLARPCPGIRGVEALAAHHVAAIRAVQPNGPYYLAGWSYGGLVVYEAARQLAMAGETVALLAIFDCPAPRTARQRGSRWRRVLTRSWRVLPAAVRLGWWIVPFARDGLYLIAAAVRREVAARYERGTTRRYVRWFVADRYHRVMRRRAGVARALDRNQQLALIDMPAIRRMFLTFGLNLREHRRYRAQPYPGVVTFFRATKGISPAGRGSRTGDWERYAQGGVQVVSVEGSHTSIFIPPDIFRLAEQFRVCLVEAQERAFATRERPVAVAGPGDVSQVSGVSK